MSMVWRRGAGAGRTQAFFYLLQGAVLVACNIVTIGTQ